MKSRIAFFFLISLVLLSSCTDSSDKTVSNQLTLWYKQPAKVWDEALPVGNGRLGAMVFGNAEKERIQINEESIWAGCPVNNNNPGSLAHLPEIQKALFDSKFKEAWQLANDNMLGTPPRIRSYQPLGDLLINYAWKTKPDNYRRSLDLKTGVAATEFTVDGKKYSQEVYATVPDNMLIVKIKALNGGAIDADFTMTREKDAVVTTTPDGKLLLTGQIIDAEDKGSGPAGAHMKFTGEARLTHAGGKVESVVGDGPGAVPSSGPALKVTGAREVTIRLTAATDFSIEKLDFDRTIDPAATCKKILDAADDKSDKDLMKRHLAEYQPMFNRVALDLGGSALDSIPTNDRLVRMKSGGEDNALIAMYFQYGRYLLMGSSRGPATLPANLQGVWNKDMNAAWNARSESVV